MTVTYPQALAQGTQYWKLHAGDWGQYPAQVDEAAGTVMFTLRDGGDLARLSRELVTLRDAPIGFELDDAIVGWDAHAAWKIRVMGEELGSEVMQQAEDMAPVEALASPWKTRANRQA